ncbi:AAA family ATPase [Paenibacillus sp. GD4]|uniref:AAA family ATPase n=1 Tax=Paenibacillus sp. GD4 TaxID=3068890 RepID=UPI002796793B|nr:AAA family ATPase [Paenibacillus sp. GD4]MDQ1913501.1 AAA family ATPase [Paenibacillus sp. GD4]
MIIWINGAFGSGKTQTSYELHRRLPQSMVFDPENAGFYIRKSIPRDIAKSDFQDYPMWREINFSMLKYLSMEYSGCIIVPMTIVNPSYFQEIVGRLRADGVTVKHFTLCASKEMLLRRLRSRGEGRQSWAAQQIDRCLAGLSDETFRHHLDTEHMTVAAAAESIAAMLQLPLRPDPRGKAAKARDRLLTQIRHIRFFS